MRIVKKNQPGTILYRLSQTERDAIFDYYGRDQASAMYTSIAMNMAQKAKALEGWLLCDCRRDESAFLYPRMTESGTLTLVRPNPEKQTQHHPSCPFYAEIKPASSTSSVGDKKPIDNFCLLKEVRTDNAADNSTPTKAKCVSRSSNYPALTTRMMHILQQAGINRVDGYITITDVFKRINTVLSKTLMWPGSTIKLSDVVATHPGAVYELYKKLRTLNWENKRKQGFIITLIDDINGQTISQGKCSLEIAGAIYKPERTPEGPYWAMILVGEEKSGSGYFSCLRASLWPAYKTQNPVPVDSDPERQTLSALIAWKLYWQKKGTHFEIYKPIDLSEMIRPDFIVTDKETGHSVVVETMGSEDDAYVARKLRTHAEMVKIGPIVEHRVGDDPLEFKKAVTRNILGR